MLQFESGGLHETRKAHRNVSTFLLSLAHPDIVIPTYVISPTT